MISPQKDKKIRTECLEIAGRVVRVWHLKPSEAPMNLVRRLGKFLTEDFDLADAAVSIVGFEDPHIRIKSDTEAEIEFSDSSGYPHRMWLRKVADEWLIAAIKFQCPACFGEGENDGESCPLCSGLGWGVSSPRK